VWFYRISSALKRNFLNIRVFQAFCGLGKGPWTRCVSVSFRIKRRSFPRAGSTQLVSIDFFTVPTALLQVLFVFIVTQHDRRRLVHFNVTAHPTAEWTARQILEAFPFETAPK
jgi:hypothetical protein